MAEAHAYALACIGLYSRLWAELERLCAAPAQAAWRSQVVRLEIDLVQQSCDSRRWRSLLSTAQRLAVQETLAGVLHCLGADAPGIGPHRAQSAQDRLLDAVREHCAALHRAAAAAQIDRILVLSTGATGPMLHGRDEEGSDPGTRHRPWPGRQASRGGQDLR